MPPPTPPTPPQPPAYPPYVFTPHNTCDELPAGTSAAQATSAYCAACDGCSNYCPNCPPARMSATDANVAITGRHVLDHATGSVRFDHPGVRFDVTVRNSTWAAALLSQVRLLLIA